MQIVECSMMIFVHTRVARLQMIFWMMLMQLQMAMIVVLSLFYDTTDEKDAMEVVFLPFLIEWSPLFSLLLLLNDGGQTKNQKPSIF